MRLLLLTSLLLAAATAKPSKKVSNVSQIKLLTGKNGFLTPNIHGYKNTPEHNNGNPLTELALQPGERHTLVVGNYKIKSPNYPNSYPNNMDAYYDLSTANAGDVISISCGAFNLQAPANHICRSDYLSVDTYKYCGTNGPDASTIGSMYIRFVTNDRDVSTGYYCYIVVSAGVSAGGGSCSCGIKNSAGSRIVGGQETDVYEYPWQVGLVSPDGDRTWCGGTIINNQYIMTAAHCTTRGPSSIEVLIKEHLIYENDGQQRFQVAQVIDHPSYYGIPGYDFSLLKLSGSITFPSDNTVAPACLPASDSNDFTGALAIVTGWGTTSSGGSQATALREVTVPVISNSMCQQTVSIIDSSEICAGRAEGGSDSCQGDSGGPLVSLEGGKYSLIGVVSWGYGCASPTKYGVYGRVSKVLDWIRTTTSGSTYCS